MSKKKAGKSGKAGAKVIPKKIGGVKLPKELRRTGEALVAKAASPAGQAAIAKGLTLAAGLATMAAERSGAKPPKPPTPPRPGESAEGAPPPPAPPPAPALEPAKVAEAVHTVADAVLGRLFPRR